MLTLAFETSCDETSVAVLDNDTILSNIILSQMFHSEWGGVVPEVASREHLNKIIEVTKKALTEAGVSLNQIELVSAANEPGLIGALLIGLNFAKSIAVSLGVPFVPVNHIQAHIYSAFIRIEKPEFPFISLIVSGGHTLLILVEDFFRHNIIGSTVDDAAGEAFDKVAKLLGLDYPGGPVIDKLAKLGNPDFHKFPLAHVKDSPFNFSFSGIKTAVLYFLKKIDFDKLKDDELINNICASFQKAVVDSLYNKTFKALKEFKIKTVTISGGVSANSGLKNKFSELEQSGFKVFIPDLEYTTDNAGMIGITGYYKYINSKNKIFFTNESFSIKAKPRIDFTTF